MRKPKPGEETKDGYSYDWMYRGYGLTKMQYPDGRKAVHIFFNGECIDGVSTLIDARWLIDKYYENESK